MRILKVHNYYTQPGGEDTVFHAEKDLLRSKGHDVFEYLEFNKKIALMNQASVALQTLWSYSSYQKIKSLLKSTKPDVVHFHNTFPLISPSAYYACQELNIPVVQTLDNQRLICPASTFYRNEKLCLDCLGSTPPWQGILHACYHNSHLHSAIVVSMITLHRILNTWQTKIDAFLCSTTFYRNLFVQAGFPPNKIVVMPHFTQQSPWIDSNNKKTKDYALFVGRLDPEKGINTLLESWRHLDFSLKIRGDGRLNEKAREFVKLYAMKNIEFIGRLEYQELLELIAGARFLIMPSEGYYETFGMVIAEAYSMKVPVLVSNIGITDEMVIDQQTGIKFEAGNPNDLSIKAQWMWSHPSELRVMGEMAFSMYQEKFTPEKCYQILLNTYERLIATNDKSHQ